jgi:hypothetical protein
VIILALDLGKFNTMCCLYNSKTRKHELINATTERTYLTTLLKKTKCELVVMEACGPSGWINHLAISLGHQTLVCSINEDDSLRCRLLRWSLFSLGFMFSSVSLSGSLTRTDLLIEAPQATGPKVKVCEARSLVRELFPDVNQT